MKKLLFTLSCILLCTLYITAQINFSNKKFKIPDSSTTLDAVAIGDLNNDNLNDLVTGAVYFKNNYDKRYLAVIYQVGDTLSMPVFIDYNQSDNTTLVNDLEVTDINNDQLNDIICYHGTTITIIQQLPSSGFEISENITDVKSESGIEVEDINNDGLMDIVALENNNFKIFYQNASGGFDLSTIPVKYNYASLFRISDLNGDGFPDLIYTDSNGSVYIFYQSPVTGSFHDNTLSFKTQPESSYSYWISGLNTGDLNDDGKNDIVVAYGGNNAYYKIFYQTFEGSIDTINALKLKSYDIPTPIIIRDLNCDGSNEIITGHTGWQKVSVFDKHNKNNYSDYQLFPSLFYCKKNSMAVGDLNNDNRPDIVNVNQEAEIIILYNTSKPTEFTSDEWKTSQITIQTDTIQKDTIVYTPIAQDSVVCKRNLFLKQEIHQQIKNNYYSGDSLYIRYGMLCSAYSDTIRVPFNYTTKEILNSDTVFSVENRDRFSIKEFQSNVVEAFKDVIYLQVYANVCWELQSDADWIKPNIFQGGNGNGDGIMQYIIVNIVISANPDFTDRNGNIILTAEGFDPIIYKIYQKPMKPAIFVSSNSVILNQQNKAILLFAANINWTISTDSAWLQLDKMKGTPTSYESYDVLSLEASPNPYVVDRYTTVTISGELNGELKTEERITVKQLKKDISGLFNTNSHFSIYPNPVTEWLILETDPALTGESFMLYNLQGNVVYQSIITDVKTIIDFKSFPEGMYILQINNGNTIYREKIVK